MITETPDDPSLNPVWVGRAKSPLHALDVWCDETGMARYSDTMKDETLSDQERGGGVGMSEEGVLWAISSNTTVYVLQVP